MEKTRPCASIHSPCDGKVESVCVKPDDYVYEWEEIAKIRNKCGKTEVVNIGVSGTIQTLYVKKGTEVSSEQIIGIVFDDLIITGSD
ncbi:hypothetical protein [Alteribacillus bidgolensis]|uniref:Biotin-requiring enzyme n=1 Tax=Alteribacillus bidgolensis TaxID=930129 RepID=A0A1G8EED8_9BACI|nr:hypothetical protein [Alteribacillus bidgolensis]SDH68244.1 hypothetical protein SAMN05216352_102190 [Alteribacillus bidgolensis]